MTTLFDHDRRAMSVAGVELEIDAIQRSGPREPIVFLHGFGSTKEDYADIVFHKALDDRPFLAYDAPGCGRSHCADLDRLSIPFLVDVALGMIDGAGFDRVHLVGHSMGGLTGLMLADAHPERVLSFTSIEGNLAPEDCFLSRQILTHADPDPDAFLDAFASRALTAPAYASALFAAGLKHKVRPGAVAPIFKSMVHLSDEAGLMERFLGLPCPRLFMYGSQNAGLSYLPNLRDEGVQLAEISKCGHFPMYSNPFEMWICLSAFFIAESD
jgi:pimeloyl-ACP methyl ester carboxylesterase